MRMRQGIQSSVCTEIPYTRRFLACMILFALVVQQSYAAIDSAAKFKDPDQV